jgi:hypothetical protein
MVAKLGILVILSRLGILLILRPKVGTIGITGGDYEGTLFQMNQPESVDVRESCRSVCCGLGVGWLIVKRKDLDCTGRFMQPRLRLTGDRCDITGPRVGLI